ESNLPYNLENTFKSLLVFFENLNVIVDETDGSHPQGRGDEQHDVDVVQLGKQQHRDQRRYDDDQTSHRWSSGFLSLSFQPKFADGFTDLLCAQEVDDFLTVDGRNHQREQHRQRRTERDVLKHSGSGDVQRLVEIFNKVIQHIIY